MTTIADLFTATRADLAEQKERLAVEDLLQTADAVLAPTYVRPRRLFVDGNGSWLSDAAGRRYLDLTSGIGVLALGHRSQVVEKALREASSLPTHVSNLYHTRAPIALARALCQASFADRVFFSNSGAEAVEGAIKFARKAAGPGRRKIVSFQGCFHGRTLGALAATDRPAAQRPFGPMPGGFTIAPFNDPRGLAAVDATTAAAIVEPVQGEGGIRPADTPWLQALRHRCDAVGAKLIFDEIQCGLGRTGRLWAHELGGVQPDLMTLAKPLAGGLPLGVVLMTEAVARAIEPGDHASTFGGGPFVTRVGLAVFSEVRRPDLLADVRRKGGWLQERLPGISEHICEVRGRGLMLGMRTDLPAGDVVRAALDEEMLVLSAGPNVVRLLPPLTITDAELTAAVERLARAFACAASRASL